MRSLYMFITVVAICSVSGSSISTREVPKSAGSSPDKALGGTSSVQCDQRARLAFALEAKTKAPSSSKARSGGAGSDRTTQ